MPTIHFLGIIVPSTAYKVSMWELPKMHYKGGDPELTIELSITIANSAIDVGCDLAVFDNDILIQAHKVAYDFARATVNLFSFASGITLTVIFDELVDPSGVKGPFVIQDSSLAQFCTAYKLVSSETPTSLSRIMGIVLSEPALWLALDDIITATSHHNSITVNCARAVEALRHAMAPPGASRGKAWELFRSNLRIGKDYLRLITDTSQSGRHGEGIFVSGTVTTEIVHRSRTVMNRFLEFRKGNNQPLNEADFPMLDK